MNTLKPKVIYESAFFVAIDKPTGWLSVPGRQGELDTRPVVGVYLRKEMTCKIMPIHRLDCEVSGIMLFAKTEDAHRQANTWFEKRLVKKTYQATTCLPHTWQPTVGTTYDWEDKMVRGKKRTFIAEHGKIAHTSATCIMQNATSIEWKLQPTTGRSHQLRVHLAIHECPIDGDVLYGSKTQNQIDGGIALLARQLDFSACPLFHDPFLLPPHLECDAIF